MWQRFGWLLVGLGLGAAGGVAFERWVVRRHAEPVTTAGVFQDVMSAIRRSFVDSLSDRELYEKAAKGVVSSLGDPYSSFLPQTEAQTYRDNLKGTAKSLGITTAGGIGGLWVESVVRGSVADRAGVTSGEFVLRLGDDDTGRMSPDQVRYRLATVDSAVTLVVRRPGDTTSRTLRLEPEPTTLPAIAIRGRLDDRIGYVAIRAVSEGVSRGLQRALTAIGARQLQGLVLDLRGNLGGRLDEALGIADLFLDTGDAIGSVSKRNEFPAAYSARTKSGYPRLQVAILVDHQTASAAEIVAAALRDNQRARLFGERTLGKGLVQTTIPLGEGTAVRLTTGRWLSPTGTPIDGGLAPDTVVRPSSLLARLARSPVARPVIATHLEAVADALVRDTTGDTVSPLDVDLELDALAESLGETGTRVSPTDLERLRPTLETEVHRLVAVMRSDASSATRLWLLNDPVVAAALASLRMADSLPGPD